MALLFRLVLTILLVGLVAPAAAQTKAYAPENLRQLGVPDRVRVIEREYSDQSGGRLIPDDQLEFYLDQVDSGWGFSEIKRDIAQSLRGTVWRAPSSGWTPRNITCSSIKHRYAECRTPFRGPVVLTYQFSDSACIEGRSWGQDRGLVWVDNGCRAQFSEAVGAGRDPGYGVPVPSYGDTSILCESREGKKRRCRTSFGGPVQLVQQESRSPCIEGDTWGWVPGEIWVRQGCRGRFDEVRGRGGLPISQPGFGRPADYSVTCSSEDERYRSCAWNAGYGRPYLIEQISRSQCIEGRSWGYDRNGLWVNHGCRARFGAR